MAVGVPTNGRPYCHHIAPALRGQAAASRGAKTLSVTCQKLIALLHAFLLSVKSVLGGDPPIEAPLLPTLVDGVLHSGSTSDSGEAVAGELGVVPESSQ
jgi:hypothetical protein